MLNFFLHANKISNTKKKNFQCQKILSKVQFRIYYRVVELHIQLSINNVKHFNCQNTHNNKYKQHSGHSKVNKGLESRILFHEFKTHLA